MIRRVSSDKHLDDFVKIYNSANQLYPKEQQYPATREVFEPQLKRDENYIATDADGLAVAFMSYYKHPAFYELTSLYVAIGTQKSGMGSELLSYFEELVPEGEYMLVKALKASTWAVQFYGKHGYTPIDDEIRRILFPSAERKAAPITESPWSVLLYKKKCNYVKI